MFGVLRIEAEAVLASVARAIAKRYTGGTPFYDALDEELRHPYWYRSLLFRYLDEYPSMPNIIVSGEFGVGFASWLAASDYAPYLPPVLIISGGIRHRELPPQSIQAKGRQYVFLDDSMYAGRTYSQIRRRITEKEGEMLGAIVLFAGSAAPLAISSFYRHSA